MPELEYNATATKKTDIGSWLTILRVTPDDPSFGFTAGQYTVLGLKQGEPRVTEADPEASPGDAGQMIRRAYSIASSSRIGEYLEFYISLVPSGELTPRLFALPAGARIYVGTKATGVFTLARVPPDRHVLLAATGTGLAPYVSMLRSELVCGGPRRFVVLHGARRSPDLGYRAELSALALRCPNFTYIPVVSRAADDPSWKGPTGYLQEILFSDLIERETGLSLSPEHYHVFLCGNPAMIDEAIRRLIERRFEKDSPGRIGTIHVEEYW